MKSEKMSPVGRDVPTAERSETAEGRARVFHAIVLLFTVLSFLLFGYATGYYTRSDGETDSVFAFFAMRGVFRRRGGGSPASEERKFAGVRGARSATRRLAEGNG